jgi:hypothetical protein
LFSSSDYKNDKNILKERVEKPDDLKEKKSIREILNLYWKNSKNFDSPMRDNSFIEEVKAEMKAASNSYNSIMDIHKILVGVYNKFNNSANKDKAQ